MSIILNLIRWIAMSDHLNLRVMLIEQIYYLKLQLSGVINIFQRINTSTIKSLKYLKSKTFPNKKISDKNS